MPHSFIIDHTGTRQHLSLIEYRISDHASAPTDESFEIACTTSSAGTSNKPSETKGNHLSICIARTRTVTKQRIDQIRLARSSYLRSLLPSRKQAPLLICHIRIAMFERCPYLQRPASILLRPQRESLQTSRCLSQNLL